METLIQLMAQADGVDPGNGQENQTSGTKVPAPGDQGPESEREPTFFENYPWTPFVLMGLVMYFVLFRGPRKKQQQHKQMLGAMKKNDRVKTIGGIIGTVVEVREQEVVLKIGETNNVKMHFARNAISTVFAEGEKVS